MIFVTKHITANDKDRKKRLKQLEQDKSKDKSKEVFKKLDELQGIAETRKTMKQIENSMFAINPIGSKINSFMNYLRSNNNSDSPKDESPYYRDFYGRKRKRNNSKRDLYGRRVKGA